MATAVGNLVSVFAGPVFIDAKGGTHSQGRAASTARRLPLQGGAGLGCSLPCGLSTRRLVVPPAGRFPVAVRASAPGDPNKPRGDGKGKAPGGGDWDTAWQAFKTTQEQQHQRNQRLQRERRRAQSPLAAMDKFVTRDPVEVKYPLTEEVDPFKRTEKRVLGVWTSTNFTLAGFGVLASLFVYMVIIVGPPPA
eukprot:jgi/Mesen1/7273/ME000373S06346